MLINNRFTLIAITILITTILCLSGCTDNSDLNTYEIPDTMQSPTNQDSPPRTQVTSVPQAPVNVSAKLLSHDSVTIEWLDNSNDEKGFNIYRGNTLIGSVSSNTQSFKDEGLSEGETYLYAVKAFNSVGESAAGTCSITIPTRPSAPNGLIIESVSSNSIVIHWNDNSNNEDGFKIYRDGYEIGTVGSNIQEFSDEGLEHSTNYEYSVCSYNEIGESTASIKIIKTLNPPLTIKVNRIGVYDNREAELRGIGEVYILVGIVDGDKSTKLRLPSNENQVYGLNKNEVIDVGNLIYSTDEVNDALRVVFIGYEDDGGTFEELAWEALGSALEAYVTGGVVSSILSVFDTSLGSIIGQLFGSEDDFLGAL